MGLTGNHVANAGDHVGDHNLIDAQLTPVQRGAWQPGATYAIGDRVFSPTGDLVTPKVGFIAGGAYVAANWNVVVPAQKVGAELAGAESSANATFAQGAGWTDVPGMVMTVPAGSAWVLEAFGQTASNQGSAAAGSIARMQARVVDSATATLTYGFVEVDFVFPGTGGAPWLPLSFRRRNASFAVDTPVKMQAQVVALTGLGNTGFYPAAAGGAPPTTMQAIGR